MTATVESTFTSLFDQASKAFGDAIKTGVKFQEDATRWWSDALEKAGPLGEWQKRTLLTVNQAIPVAQKNTEELMRNFEANYKKGLDLLKKAFSQNGNGGDYQAKIREVWQDSLELVREGTQSVANSNVKMMQLLADLLKQNAECVTNAAKAAATKVTAS
jgi:hypothetical protein